jgi:Zn-dependent peptidase ImmA (M78 family)
MSVQVTVQPQVLRWARERASLATDELARRLNLKEERVAEWERTGQLSLAHLERVASKTHTPVGYLFLPAPPKETLPIPDFRTLDGEGIRQPSPELLDTIYQCQQRQDWYREHLLAEGEDPLRFVGSSSLTDAPVDVAVRIRTTLGFSSAERAALPNWEETLRVMVERIEAARILVMRNSVVGNNNYRKLSVDEFRGFALCDEYAPLIFVNAADPKSAQMFTLAHELGHLWLGQSGVSDADPNSAQQSERFCNAVAAEVLVPLEEFRAVWQAHADPLEEAHRLCRLFKVSSLVMLIRAREAGVLPLEAFDKLYRLERAGSGGGDKPGGGDFYLTQRSRLGKRFARAVIGSALEGRTTYTTAFQLLGLRKGETFDQLAKSLGVTH